MMHEIGGIFITNSKIVWETISLDEVNFSLKTSET